MAKVPVPIPVLFDSVPVPGPWTFTASKKYGGFPTVFFLWVLAFFHIYFSIPVTGRIIDWGIPWSVQ